RNLRIVRRANNAAPSKVRSFDHHLCHAASSFYMSPFDRALILTLDEEGDGTSGMVAVGEGTQIRVLRTIPFPNSLAWVYSQITRLLGFVPHKDEHKTQWLSLDGEPLFQKTFLEMLGHPKNHLPHLNLDFFNPGLSGKLPFSSKFYQQTGLT